jgi:AcrR family transcriptional regulator
MFLDRGYAASDLDSIIRVTGGSKTNVYSQFGSKEGLLKAVVLELFGGVTEELHQSDLSGLELRAGLVRFGRDLLGVLMEPRHVAFQRLILAESARVADVAAAWHAIGPERIHAAIDRFLAAKRDEGVFVGVDTLTAATLFHDMLVHSPLNRALLGRPYSSREIRDHVQRVVETFLGSHLS